MKFWFTGTFYGTDFGFVFSKGRVFPEKLSVVPDSIMSSMTFKRLRSVMCDDNPNRKNVEKLFDEWDNISVIATLLASIGSYGMFTSGSYVHQITSDLYKNHSTEQYNPEFQLHAKIKIAKIAVALYCMVVFCFLNATVLSTAYKITFQTQKFDTVDDLKRTMGWVLFCLPSAYFRIGFFLMICGFSVWFLIVLKIAETSACLLLCSSMIISPMVLALTKLSKFQGGTSCTEDPF